MIRYVFASFMVLLFLPYGACYAETMKFACEATLENPRNSEGAFIEGKDMKNGREH